MPNFFGKSNDKIYLALDAGTESIKAILFENDKDKIKVLGSSLYYPDNFRLIEGNFGKGFIKKAVAEAVGKNKNIKKIAGVFLGLSPDILKGEIISETYQRGEGKGKVSDREEKEIIDILTNSAQQEVARNYAEKTGILPKDIIFINQKILRLKLDGYKILKLSGFEGKTIDARFLMIFLPKYYFEKIEKIFKDLDLKILKIIHLAEVLPIKIPDANSILIDIGGLVTQIILLKDGVADKIDVIDTGGKVFSETIAETLGLDEGDSRDLKERYSKGELSESSRAKTREIIQKNIQDWFEKIKAKLFDAKTLLPPRIYIFGGASQLLGIEEILTDGDWKETHTQSHSLEPSFSFILPPQVKFILPKELINNIYVPDNLNNPQFVSTFILLNS